MWDYFLQNGQAGDHSDGEWHRSQQTAQFTQQPVRYTSTQFIIILQMVL